MRSPSVFDAYIEDWKIAVPETVAAVHLEETGLQGVFFDSVPFKGRLTRVFAWIGVSGVSWGGCLTCMAAGLDSRWKCAMPVYGCGFLNESPVSERFQTNDPETQKLWHERWDPARFLPQAACPMFWLTVTSDLYFPR